ncbi:MAG TPA: tetratricopeptide repeat protein [Planctomycetes bacterium]|nr:tetratricopeptide repeat protein [Planctomycetota bacterium]
MKSRSTMAFERRWHSSRRGPPGGIRGVLGRVVDGGLAATVLVLPFLFGGRHPLGRMLLVVLAVAVAAAWSLRQLVQGSGGWRRSGAGWLLWAATALLVLQCTAVPDGWVESLGGRTAELLTLWNQPAAASAGLGNWSYLSLAPSATRSGLVLFVAYGLLFWVTVQRVRSVEHVERILGWYALAAVLMAGFGLVQYLSSNGKFYWFYDHPFSSTSDAAKGGFTNRNHFAHFLALGLGPLIWWVQRRLRSARSSRSAGSLGFVSGGQRAAATWGILGLGIVLFAVLLSLSRGGALVAALAVAVVMAVAIRAGAVRWQFGLAAGGAALLVLLALAIFGSDRVSERLDDLAASPLELVDQQVGRRTIWAATVRAIGDFTFVGSGVGSFPHVYPIYLPWRPNRFYYTHAENGYLQVTLETGVVGLALLAVGLAVCALWCLKALRRSESARSLVCAGAVTAGLVTSAVHSLVDFVWYVPACMAAAVVLAGCACRLAQMSAQRAEPQRGTVTLPRTAWALLTVGVLALGVWMVGDRLGPVMAAGDWRRIQSLMQAAGEAQKEEAPDGWSPWEKGDPEQQRESGRLAVNLVQLLERIVRWEPNNPEAHLQLAGAYLQLFDGLQQGSVNRMPLGQVKDAALAARRSFETAEAYRRWLRGWLDRAVGPHHRYLQLALDHARQGLKLCPLRGEGYLYLAELCFLDGASPEAKRAYVDQALAVRPYDGMVLFHAGNEALLEGDLARWHQYWQRCYRSGRIYQRALIDHLVGRLGPGRLDAEIDLLLDTFHPDLWALRYAYYRYRRFVGPERLGRLRAAYAQAAEAEAAQLSGPEAARRWVEAMSLYADPDQVQRRIACGRRALRADPNHYDAHYRLAVALIEAGQLEEAEEELRWCWRRRPGDPALERRLRDLRRQRQLAWRMPAAPVPSASR